MTDQELIWICFEPVVFPYPKILYGSSDPNGDKDIFVPYVPADRIEEVVMERDMLRDFDDHFRSMCGFKRDGRSSIECFDDFLAGINKQDIPLPFDHFLQVQKERDEALAKLNKAVKWFKKLDRRGDIWEFFDPFVHKVVTAALAELKGQE